MRVVNLWGETHRHTINKTDVRDYFKTSHSWLDGEDTELGSFKAGCLNLERFTRIKARLEIISSHTYLVTVVILLQENLQGLW